MKKTKLLTLAALAVLLLTLPMATLVFATTVSTFTLSSASSNQLQYVLPQGTTFNGTISTTGSVRFWVSDPNMAEIVNLGIIDKTATFGFVAQQSGTYTLNFENDVPNSNSIQVTFSYVTNPEIPSSNNSSGGSLIYLLITIVIAAIGSIVIILLLRRKNKIHASPSDSTVAQTQYSDYT